MKIHSNNLNRWQHILYLGIGCLLLLLTACNSATPPPPSPTPTAVPTARPANVVTGDFDIVSGQTLYVPAYSQIYHYDKKPINLAVTLGIHNTDPDFPILITTVDYYNSQGVRIKSLLSEPQTLGPLVAADYFIDEANSEGVGANFIVKWVADRRVYEPVVEAIMISTSGTQGISFISPGRVITQTR